MKDILNILRYSKQLRSYYLTIMGISILVAAVTQAQPFITKFVVDEITGNEPSAAFLITLVILYFASDFLLTVATNIGGYFGDMMTVKLRRFLSERYYEHLMKLPQRYFDNQRTGALVNKLNRSIEQLTQTLQFFSNSVLQLFLTTILTFVVTAYYSPIAALLMFIIYPILFWLTTRTSERWQEIEHEKNDRLDDAFGRFTEVVSQMRVVKSFKQGQREHQRFQSKFGEIIPLTETQSKFWHKQDILRRAVLNLIFAGIFAVIVWQAYNDSITVGQLVLLLQYALLMRVPLFSLSFIVDSAQKSIAASRDFFEVMNLAPEEDPRQDAVQVELVEPAAASVEFNNVSFAYEELAVINDMSFRIEPGEKLALVSESGGGKTTLSNLLIGIYKANSGDIAVAGRNLKDESLSWLRGQVGVVFQDAELFSGTVKENIAYSAVDSDQSSIEQAAVAANAHEFIMELPDRYETQIGERGVKLSGGQKQRIAIARALLKDAPILILDEATSALDSKTEIEVQAALDRLMENRTSLIIAHRLSTISNVDKIITLRNGTIEEMGSPQELAASGGTYAQLLKLQTASSEEKAKYLKQFDIHA